MSKVFNLAIPVSLLVAALLLSACATQQEVTPAPAPVPAEVIAEKPVTEVAPAPAAVAAVVEEPPQASTQEAVKQEAPKKVIRKAKETPSKPASPKVQPLAPVVEPAPAVATPPPAVVQPEAKPATEIAPPVKEVTVEAGFFEQYWMWLIGLIVIIAGVVFWIFKNRE